MIDELLHAVEHAQQLTEDAQLCLRTELWPIAVLQGKHWHAVAYSKVQ